MGRTIKDLSTCFLTYHTLSSSFQGIHSLTHTISHFCIVVSSLLFEFKESYVYGRTIYFYIICDCYCIDGVDMDLEDDLEGASERKRKVGEGMSLPPFGLATYKMQGNVWVSGNRGRDQERLVSLLSVADSWLKQLRVQHHDFNYFTGIRRG